MDVSDHFHPQSQQYSQKRSGSIPRVSLLREVGRKLREAKPDAACVSEWVLKTKVKLRNPPDNEGDYARSKT